MEHFVKNSSELENIITTLINGDTVYLAPGVYSGLNFSNLNFDDAITVKSFDNSDPAIIENLSKIENCNNITISNVIFQYTDVQGSRPNNISNSLLSIIDSNSIQVLESEFLGFNSDFTDESIGMYEGYPFGIALNISNSDSVTVGTNYISTLHRGIRLDKTNDVKIENNHLEKIRIDGVNGTDHIGTKISENLFENFRPYRLDPDNLSGFTDEHSDMIQFWAKGAEYGVHDFKISDNIFIQKDYQSQTVFGRNNIYSNQDPSIQYFSNFEISGNLIYNGHFNAISLTGVNGARIFDNTVIPNEIVSEDKKSSPIVYVGYMGDRPTAETFDIDSVEVQMGRDFHIYNNIFTKKNDEIVTIKAYNKNVNEYEDVTENLKLVIEENRGFDTREINQINHREKVKFNFLESEDENLFLIDQESESLYDGIGSEYYYSAQAMENFFSKMKTAGENSVKQVTDWSLDGSFENFDAALLFAGEIVPPIENWG